MGQCASSANRDGAKENYLVSTNVDSGPIKHVGASMQYGTRIQKLIFLGTGSAVPQPGKRHTSGLALVLSTGNAILVDAGEAIQMQIMKSLTVKASKISTILITHLHGDHSFGLFGLLCTMGQARGPTDALTLIGPKGVKAMVMHVLTTQAGFNLFVQRSADHGGDDEDSMYPLHFIELEGERPFGDDGLLMPDGLTLHAHRLEHVPSLDTYGYFITEPKKLGALNAARAYALGARKEDMKVLKDGIDVIISDGDKPLTISAHACLSPPTLGRTIAVLQDTYDTRRAEKWYLNHRRCACEYGCGDADVMSHDGECQCRPRIDLLVHECTYGTAFREKAIANGHSTSAMAGECAHRLNAKMLVLTHFSTRYETRHLRKSSSSASSVTCEGLRDEALDAYKALSDESSSGVASSTPASLAASFDSAFDVIVAEDFLIIETEAKKKAKKSKTEKSPDATEEVSSSWLPPPAFVCKQEYDLAPVSYSIYPHHLR